MMNNFKICYVSILSRIRAVNRKFYNKVNVKFSIILPTYNRASCITKAIDSLLCQTYQNFELIIVDDGSSDSTEDLIKKNYAKQILSRKIIYRKLLLNRGGCYARNQGQKLARGKWIAYLDSDNEMAIDFLETFKNAIVCNPDNKIFYTQIRKESNGEVIGRDFDFDELCRGNYIDLGVFVHHKSMIKKYGNFDENLRRLQDWDLIIRYTRVEKPIYLAKPLLSYNDSNAFKRISNSESHEEAERYIMAKHNKI